MFRYILAILLINTCYHSLGNPVPKRISISLTGLAIHCENPLMNNIIKSKIKECSITVPPFSEKQFQCLIFYDMSNQLCSAVSTSQLTLNEDDYSAKIKEELDVNSVCETAKDWEFANMSEFAAYKTALERVFKHPVTCGKVCAAEELTSTDANFFCKFFSWGLGTLKSTVATTSQKSANVTLFAPVPAAVLPDIKNEVPEQTKESLDIPIKNTTNDKSKVTEASLAPTPEKVSDPSDIESKPDTILTSTNKEVSSSVVAPKDEKNEETKLDEPPVLAENVVSDNDKIEKEVDNSIPVGSSDKVELNSELEHKESVLENPKKNPQSDGFDYQDTDVESEEGKDGLIDMQGGDDGDDPMIDDGKSNKEQSKADDHKEPSLSSFNREISQGDYYHTVQDGYSDGDDDHFFTFFLTAVVMVILLYILYHNKNKVGKVFFGLLLEGRQPGRRRNSRGHAYRRLDTLEQAMSTNTAAPPSKIIY